MKQLAFDKYSRNVCGEILFYLDDISIKKHIKKTICNQVIKNAECLDKMLKHDFKTMKELFDKGHITKPQVEEILDEMDKLVELFYKQIKKYGEYIYERPTKV